MTTPTALERPVYGISQAARLLGLRTDALRRWVDGYEKRAPRTPRSAARNAAAPTP